MIAISAKDLHDELSGGLASSDEVQRLFGFAVDPNGGFRKNLEGKWFAYDDAARFKHTVPAYGPFETKQEAMEDCQRRYDYARGIKGRPKGELVYSAALTGQGEMK